MNLLTNQTVMGVLKCASKYRGPITNVIVSSFVGAAGTATSNFGRALFNVKKYDVKRGLRDVSGQGVLTGLTEVSEIVSHTMIDRDYVPCEGKLRYRGIDVEELVEGYFVDNELNGLLTLKK
mgnify:CR=1 FL=1